LIKKIRGSSNQPEAENFDGSGFLKKQTPISERNNDSGKPGMMLGKAMYNNSPPGFSSVREQNRFDGTMTPHNDNGYNGGVGNGSFSGNGIRGLGSPDNGSVNSGRSKQKWNGQSALPNNNTSNILGDLHSRKTSNSHVGNPISNDPMGVTPRMQNGLNLIGNKSKLHSLQ
jgi:hypothetical protein